MKYFSIVLVLLVLVVGAVYFLDKNSSTKNLEIDNNQRLGDDVSKDQLNIKIKADVFSGKLEEVNTGCFADGECFVVVSGKHITALMGWSRDTVGKILGVDGFGDLENYIGKEVEVYAQDKGDGTYTLYGSEGFYIKLK